MRMKKACIAMIGAFAAIQSVTAAPAFTMRFDDNHTPALWNKLADIFERHGMRCSFAVVPTSLTEEQGACLKALAARGHVIMDHTPNHAFYTATYHDAAAYARAKTLPFVHEADDKRMTLRFKPTVDDACKANRRVRVRIVANKLEFVNAMDGRRILYSFIKIPGRSELFGMQKGKRKGDHGYELRDFWRRPLKEQLNLGEVEVTLYKSGIQPCDDILRELASISRERFVHFGLPLPKIWVRPGGWEPGIAWDRLERIYGREFGYVGADSSVGAAKGSNRWTTGYDAMYFFDQGADITPEQLVDQIQKKIAAGKYHVTLSHTWSKVLPGGEREYLEKTERFAKLIEERKIPTMTMLETLDDRFGKCADR